MTASPFTVWSRADIPKNYPDDVKDLIMVAMDSGGTARLSTNGHVIIRTPDGQTTSVGKNTGGNRSFANAKASVSRLFPAAAAQVEDTTEPELKMCKICKEHKSLDEFSYDKRKDYRFATCKECTTKRAKARRQTQKVKATVEQAPVEKPPFERPIRKSPEIWEPTDTLSKLTRVINDEAAQVIARLQHENRELRAALEAIHRDTGKWSS